MNQALGALTNILRDFLVFLEGQNLLGCLARGEAITVLSHTTQHNNGRKLRNATNMANSIAVMAYENDHLSV